MAGPLETFIFIGRSGAGKGTQANRLVETLGQKNSGSPVLYLETGARFRRLFTGRTWTSERARDLANLGHRLPSFLAIWNWAESLINDFNNHQALVIDGSPRSLLEAEALDTAFEFYQRFPVQVVFLKVGDEEAIRRLQKRGRPDDQELKRIRKRLAWFDAEVQAAVDFYRRHPKRYCFATIDGEQTVAEVWSDIVEVLGL